MITCSQIDIYVTVYNVRVYNIIENNICNIFITILFLDVGPEFGWRGAALQNSSNTITLVTLNFLVTLL